MASPLSGESLLCNDRAFETGLDFFLARYYSGAQGRINNAPRWPRAKGSLSKIHPKSLIPR